MLSVDYYHTVLLLQTREPAESDLGKLSLSSSTAFDTSSQASSSTMDMPLTDKIDTAKDIFEYSTPREYNVMLERLQRENEQKLRKLNRSA